ACGTSGPSPRPHTMARHRRYASPIRKSSPTPCRWNGSNSWRKPTVDPPSRLWGRGESRRSCSPLSIRKVSPGEPATHASPLATPPLRERHSHRRQDHGASSTPNQRTTRDTDHPLRQLSRHGRRGYGPARKRALVRAIRRVEAPPHRLGSQPGGVRRLPRRRREGVPPRTAACPTTQRALATAPIARTGPFPAATELSLHRRFRPVHPSRTRCHVGEGGGIATFQPAHDPCVTTPVTLLTE